MAVFTVKNLTFTYPDKQEPALKGINLNIEAGEFIAVCGQSGSGKSTLLRNLKPILAPHGKKQGEMLFYGAPVESLSQESQAAGIGYVLQNPDNQIVTDKVWHELAFGLENLGMESKTIRLRVAEMASFFGIQSWFHKDVNHLSGGQRQLLNLAAVMAMQPDVLILDEPTAQLDPIAAGDFLETVKKINRELGTTVIITEHRLEEVLPMADRAVVLDGGSIIADDIPANAGALLSQKNHLMFMAMPTPLQAYAMLYQEGIGKNLQCPLDVREGRKWLSELLHGKELSKTSIDAEKNFEPCSEPAIELKDVWFRYERSEPDVIKGLSLKIYPKELFCIVGGNGTGKTTALSLVGGIRKPYRGVIKLKGKSINKYKKNELFQGMIGVLPQNPQSIFVEKTVRLDLMEMLEGHELTDEKKNAKVSEVAEMVEIEHLMEMHPYDLSGGEQQRAALAKVLLLEPEILLLDEPTKGIDSSFKAKLADILKSLKSRGITIVMVSHDVEFCAGYGDRCAMFFDGKIITTNTPREFFSGNSFYTTAGNRMSRHVFENAITAGDIAELVLDNIGEIKADDGSGSGDGRGAAPYENDENSSANGGQDNPEKAGITEALSVVTLKTEAARESSINDKKCRGSSKAILDTVMLLLAAVTVWAGFYVFDNKQYFIVGSLLVIYALIPFFARFERRKPKAREIVILAVLIAAAVVGRAAFFMLPNFKPILAIIIISGTALGKEAGALTGAMSAMVSNFLFGQGPWTPWQMLAMSLIGYLAGLIFHRYSSSLNKYVLMIFGGLAAFFIYGGIVDIWTIFMMTPEPTIETVIMVYGAAAYFNLIHAAATMFFIFLLAKPIIGKLDRVKLKYGMTVYSSKGAKQESKRRNISAQVLKQL